MLCSVIVTLHCHLRLIATLILFKTYLIKFVAISSHAWDVTWSSSSLTPCTRCWPEFSLGGDGGSFMSKAYRGAPPLVPQYEYTSHTKNLIICQSVAMSLSIRGEPWAQQVDINSLPYKVYFVILIHVQYVTDNERPVIVRFQAPPGKVRFRPHSAKI